MTYTSNGCVLSASHCFWARFITFIYGLFNNAVFSSDCIVAFESFTGVTVKSTVFLDMMPSSLIELLPDYAHQIPDDSTFLTV
jgi:hypothetical protein